VLFASSLLESELNVPITTASKTTHIQIPTTYIESILYSLWKLFYFIPVNERHPPVNIPFGETNGLGKPTFILTNITMEINISREITIGTNKFRQ